MTQTIAQWLAQSHLPRLESRLLLQKVTDFSHAQLIARDDFILSENQIYDLNQYHQRRLQGEPMAYILGEKEFYGRSFAVSSAVLIPRPETEHLVETAIAKLPPNGTAWDLGTGSGIIAISLKLERPDATVWASDIRPESLEIAQQNAKNLGAQIHFGLGSWFDINNKPNENQIDIIISNPPYIEHDDVHLQQGDLRFEPLHALTDFADGLNPIRHLAQNAPIYLKENGFLLLEHGYNQGQAVRDILAEHHFHEIETIRDLAGLERITLGKLGKIGEN